MRSVTGRVWRRIPINILSVGVLLMLFAVLVSCSNGPRQDDAGQKVMVKTPTPLPVRPTATPAPTVTPTQPPPQNSALRSKPRQVSEDEMATVFGVDSTNWRPLKYLKHTFQDRGNMVVDQTTGLTWQKSGSTDAMTYAQAKAYLAQLNQTRFGGYANWRLPTMAELLSLVESQAQKKEWYLNLAFDQKQTWCWSADTVSATEAWAVNFQRGSVNWLTLTNCYVRAVRP